MLQRKPFTTYLEVRTQDGFHRLCQLDLTPIGSSDIEPPDSWWTQLLGNLVKRPLDTRLLEELDSLQKVRLDEQKP